MTSKPTADDVVRVTEALIWTLVALAGGFLLAALMAVLGLACVDWFA